MFTPPITVTRAQMQALFSAPPTIFAGNPAGVLLPKMVHIRKASGAYTLGSAGIITLAWPGVGFGLMNVCNVAGMMDAAGEESAINYGPGNYAGWQAVGALSARVGLGLQLKQATANMSGAGGECEVTIEYDLVPLRIAASRSVFPEYVPGGFQQ